MAKKTASNPLGLPKELEGDDDTIFTDGNEHIDTKLDVSSLLWRQIDRLNRLVIMQPYTENFVMGVEMLDNLLCFIDNPEFQKKHDNISKTYNAALKKKEIRRDQSLQLRERVKLANETYKLLIKLMAAHGMLPNWILNNK